MEVVEVDINELKTAEYNPRVLFEKDGEDIEKSINKFDLVEPIVVNKNENRKNIVIGGNQRLKILKKMGRKTVFVNYVDIPDIEDEKELNIRLNKNQAHWDYEMLANDFEIDDLLKWGFDEFDLKLENNFDPEEEWKEMPEYGDLKNKEAYRTIYVHFENEEAIKDFAELIQQKITEKTKWVWHPKKEDENIKQYVVKTEK